MKVVKNNETVRKCRVWGSCRQKGGHWKKTERDKKLVIQLEREAKYTRINSR